MISLRNTFANAAAAFQVIRNKINSVFGRNQVKARMFSMGGDLEQLLHTENRRAILAGLDKDDRMMPITKRQLDPRRSASLGAGPPLAPHDGVSRVITEFRTQIEEGEGGAVNIVGMWPGAGFLRYHSDTGQPRTLLPVRDIVGIRPSTRAQIEKRVSKFTEDFRIPMGPEGVR